MNIYPRNTRLAQAKATNYEVNASFEKKSNEAFLMAFLLTKFDSNYLKFLHYSILWLIESLFLHALTRTNRTEQTELNKQM